MKISKILSSSVIAISFLGFSIGGMLYTNTHANADGNSSLNKPSGSNTAGTSSLATLKLTNGYLALDNVPNLNFGGTNDPNQNNTLNLQSSGLLRVTDYRNNSEDNPWELDVNMDPFKHDSSNNESTTDKTWQMQLNNSQALQNEHNENNSTQSSEGKDIPINSYSKFNDDNNDTAVMQGNGGNNGGYGTNSINYNNSDATLTVPSVKPDSYYTTMHWTLSANMTDKSNDNGNDTNSSNNADNQANQNINKSDSH